jgi:hypothetical protein
MTRDQEASTARKPFSGARDWTGSRSDSAQLSMCTTPNKAHWLVKFMRRGFEPPMPFGKTQMVIAAKDRSEAARILQSSGMVSPSYPKVTASKTDLEVSYHFKFSEDPSYSF